MVLWLLYSLLNASFLGYTSPETKLVQAQASTLHDFHTSLAEMNYNTSKKRFEVSLRVFSDDFEEAIQNLSKNAKLSLDDSEKYKPLIQSYLEKHFQIISSNNKRLSMKYLGMETELEGFLLFIEIPCSSIQAGYKFRNSVLVDRFDDQVNLVNIRYKDLKTTLMFLKGKTLLDFPSK